MTISSLGEALPSTIQVLRRSELCRGLDDAAVALTARGWQSTTVAAGQTIFHEHDAPGAMYLIVSGQVKAFRTVDGREVLLEYLGRGEHFGEISLLMNGPRLASAMALTETRLLTLDQPQFNELVATVPDLAVNLSRGLVRRLQWEANHAKRRRQPAVVAMVNTSRRTQDLLAPLAQSLSERGDVFRILTTRDRPISAATDHVSEQIVPPSQQGSLEALHSRVHEILENQNRVLIDVTQEGLDGELIGVLVPCEEIWWLVEPHNAPGVFEHVASLLAKAPQLAGRMHFVWIVEPDKRFSPRLPDGLHVAQRDFKVMLADGKTVDDRQQDRSVQRLVRHLRGTRLGLALGGGSARGLAHFGAMRVFEREGIDFDIVAGTSSGALMGLPYAGGWHPQEAIERFEAALTPHRLWRLLPRGHSLYLLAMFRLGLWDAMLRPYLHDLTLEQLPVPLCTVSVDLVRGVDVVRDSGDAIRAVMESINIPFVARPILRDGMALIDGALLNNVPVDALAERGADFIVGIDVVARVRPQFAGNRPDTPTERMRNPSLISTFSRIVEVQSHHLISPRMGGADVMITPDTAGYDFADFSKARPLADAGEAATLEVLPQLKEKLAALDRR